MDSNELAPSNGSNAIVKSYSEDLEWLTAIGKSLDLAASILGKSLTEAEVEFWKESLQWVPAKKLEQAFREYLAAATEDTFFPRPGDILLRVKSREVDLVDKVRAQVRGGSDGR